MYFMKFITNNKETEINGKDQYFCFFWFTNCGNEHCL